MPEWFETFFDGLFTDVLAKRYDESQSLAHARVVKRVLELRKGQHALDVPCGMGRLTIPLAKMGLVMTGVDLTAPYLRRARRAAKGKGLDTRFVLADMRDIAFDAEFDAAFNWFGSFGYFSDTDNVRFCKRVWQALKPGGRFLIEGMNKSWLLAHFRSGPQQDTIGGVRVVTRNRWDAATGRVHGTWTYSKGHTTERHRMSMRIYDGTEIRAVLRAAGFRDIRLFGYPPLGRFTRHSRRLLAVGRRPRT